MELEIGMVFWHKNIIYDFNGLCVLKCTKTWGCWSRAKIDHTEKRVQVNIAEDSDLGLCKSMSLVI